MKIVIDVPEEIYDRCREYRLRCGEAEVLEGAVANGTPLSKGHGDLKDYNTLDDTIARLNEQGWGVTRYEYKRISGVLFEMPTIIEADKGGD